MERMCTVPGCPPTVTNCRPVFVSTFYSVVRPTCALLPSCSTLYVESTQTSISMMHSPQHRPFPSPHSSHYQQFGHELPTPYLGRWGHALPAVAPGPSRRISNRASANIVPYSLSSQSPRTKGQRTVRKRLLFIETHIHFIHRALNPMYLSRAREEMDRG